MEYTAERLSISIEKKYKPIIENIGCILTIELFLPIPIHWFDIQGVQYVLEQSETFSWKNILYLLQASICILVELLK